MEDIQIPPMTWREYYNLIALNPYNPYIDREAIELALFANRHRLDETKPPLNPAFAGRIHP